MLLYVANKRHRLLRSTVVLVCDSGLDHIDNNGERFDYNNLNIQLRTPVFIPEIEKYQDETRSGLWEAGEFIEVWGKKRERRKPGEITTEASSFSGWSSDALYKYMGGAAYPRI